MNISTYVLCVKGILDLIQNLVLFCSPQVTMCGYTLEHPAESKMLLRIQTKNGNVYELLKQGLEDLGKMCDHTIETFDKVYEKYESSQDAVESP